MNIFKGIFLVFIPPKYIETSKIYNILEEKEKQVIIIIIFGVTIALTFISLSIIHKLVKLGKKVEQVLVLFLQLRFKFWFFTEKIKILPHRVMRSQFRTTFQAKRPHTFFEILNSFISEENWYILMPNRQILFYKSIKEYAIRQLNTCVHMHFEVNEGTVMSTFYGVSVIVTLFALSFKLFFMNNR